MSSKSKVYITRSDKDLQTLGKKLLQEGVRVFLLNGQLGAGKTTLVRGIAQALGWTKDVPSPTFTLMKEYPVTVAEWKKKYDRLVHIDLYRLQDELNPLPIAEWVSDPRCVVAIEWPTPGCEWLVAEAAEINFELQVDESRRVTVIPL